MGSELSSAAKPAEAEARAMAVADINALIFMVTPSWLSGLILRAGPVLAGAVSQRPGEVLIINFLCNASNNVWQSRAGADRVCALSRV